MEARRHVVLGVRCLVCGVWCRMEGQLSPVLYLYPGGRRRQTGPITLYSFPHLRTNEVNNADNGSVPVRADCIWGGGVRAFPPQQVDRA